MILPGGKKGKKRGHSTFSAHDDLQRILGTVGGISTPEDILTKADTYGTPDIQAFASKSFTYYASNANTASVTTPFQVNENLQNRYGGTNFDETNFVKTETVNGCGGCGTTGSVTKSYFYIDLNAINLLQDTQNIVARLVVEDSADSSGNPLHRTVYGLSGGLGHNNGRRLRQVIIQSPLSSPTTSRAAIETQSNPAVRNTTSPITTIALCLSRTGTLPTARRCCRFRKSNCPILERARKAPFPR